jgi:hypothetical protein
MADEETNAAPALVVSEVAAPVKKLGFGLGFKKPVFNPKSVTVQNLTTKKFGEYVPKPYVQQRMEEPVALPASSKPVAATATVSNVMMGPPGGGVGDGEAESAVREAVYGPVSNVMMGPPGGGNEEAPEEAAAATAEAVSFREKLKTGRKHIVSKPIPTTAPIMSRADFSKEKDGKKAFKGPNPIEQPNPAAVTFENNEYTLIDPVTKRIVYAPITAPYFSDFMVQAYKQYSPILLKIMKEGPDFLKAPKVNDPNACENRISDNVENFYYQKLVRDYLSRDTPYRGLLVYHGLGSGKTCTSIAAAEALYWGGKKTIYVLTPATLSNNYRRELGKCGYYPLRQNNFWTFVKLDPAFKTEINEKGDYKSADPVFLWATDQGMGLPASIVLSQGGFWYPNPTKASNWGELDADSQESIREQQRAHLNHRFKFIHYNGVMPSVLARLALDGIKEGKSMFDNAVIILDEIHNLVRTINGTLVGTRPIPQFIRNDEPREFTWTAPMERLRPGFRYPRGYTLYRLLQNAVGAKIIALSATPMINYAQEMAVLMNIIGGEIRTVEIPLKSMNKDVPLSVIEEWARQSPDIDFYSIEEASDRSTVLVVTPVPFGFSKVVAKDYTTRGFVRIDSKAPFDSDVKASRERNMDIWALSLLESLAAKGVFPPTVPVEAKAAVDAAKATGKPLVTEFFRLKTYPVLPDDPTEFVDNFVDRSTLKILNADVLRSRCYGLISYYRGGSEDLMPRVTAHKIVEVPMSETMFKEYTVARAQELDLEKKKPAEQSNAAGEEAKPVKGVSRVEQDLYTQATKTQQTGFLALSRAACNWVFPPEIPRPAMSDSMKAKLLGIEPERTIAADLAVDTDINVEPAPATTEGPAEDTDAVLKDEKPATAPPSTDTIEVKKLITSLLAPLKENADMYLNKGLATYSPKYAMMLDIIRSTPGPSLVYSQFKTLEGLGIFAAALEAADEKFVQLDIQKNARGEWVIPDAIMADMARPRYILYTGDQDLEKRRLLLQLYNADVGGLPPTLAEQCKVLLGMKDDTIKKDNRNGEICRVFMITQSGAEGISLFNTRAVLIMEPYWNNVRIQQVIGRAIRLCSHMYLPYKDRTVDVYTFLSVFTAEQKAGDAKIIMRTDSEKTTDQMIHEIAKSKQLLADGLMDIAQTAAIDCDLHYHEHGAVTKCFKYSEGGRPMFMYHPDWRRDILAMAGVRAKE